MTEPLQTRNDKAGAFLSRQATFLGLVMAGGTVVTASSIIAFFGGLHWTADLFSHFRLQYALSLLLAAGIAAFARRWRATVIFSFVAAVNAAILAPQFVANAAHPVPPGSKPIRVMLANVNAHHGNPERAMAVVLHEDPDLLLLEEVSDRWIPELERSLTNYPHRIVEPRDDNFGIAFFSRIPTLSCVVTNIGSAEVPSVLTEVHTANGSFMFLGTHPLPPAGATYSAYRNEQLELLSAVAVNQRGPAIVMGDLNATPWSSHFRRLLRNSGLLDSSRGHGIRPTWPTHNVLLRIPLDHFLHTKDIAVVSRKVGPNTGSDHYPLVVDFVVLSGTAQNRR